MMIRAYAVRMHPSVVWAVEAGVLTMDEACTLSRLAAWEDETTVDAPTAALMRRYLHWVASSFSLQ